MCGLYSFRKTLDETRALFKFIEDALLAPRDYVTPGSPIAIVRAGENRKPAFTHVRWGLVPSWSKEGPKGRPLTNARSETVYEKASFRHAIRRRRCFLPADGFYEWQGDIPGKKQAYFIHRPDQSIFAFGGLWEHWMGADGSELESAAMLTTTPGLPVSDIHDRSPVVIMPGDFERWLSDEEDVQDLLKPPPDDFWVMEKTTIARQAPPPRPAPQPKTQMDLF